MSLPRLLAWILLLAASARANLIAELSLLPPPNTLRLGDPFELVLQVEHDPALAVEWIPPDEQSLRPLVLLGEGRVDTLRAGLLQKRWPAAVYETGEVSIAPLEVLVQDEGGPLRLASDSLRIRIRSVLPVEAAPDSLAPRDIRDPREVPLGPMDLLPWLLALLGLVLVALLARRLWRRRPAAPAAAPPPSPDPWEVFTKELARIGREERWRRGELVDYYAELSLCARGLLEDCSGKPWREMSRGEVEEALPTSPLDEASARDLLRWLDLCELVIYARHEPPLERHGELLAALRSWGEKARPRLQPSPEAGT